MMIIKTIEMMTKNYKTCLFMRIINKVIIGALYVLFKMNRRSVFCMVCTLFYFVSSDIVSISDETITPMPTDTRIKTFIYSPNEIFQVKFVVGYQSIIELQKDEDVELITFGDATPWTVKTLGRRIFLKAAEPGLKTNMTIFTDKRTYLLEIMSNGDDDDNDERITYLLRFFYPDINVDVPPTATKLAKIALNKRVAMDTRTGNTIAEGAVASNISVNTNYTYAKKGNNADAMVPTMVFDNGNKTYFKFKNDGNVPIISAVMEDFQEIPLRARRSGEYIYVDTVERQFTIRRDKNIVCVFNESPGKKASVAYVNGK